jgi:DNA-binding winged helix-turn-helix (wHTH) protein
MAFMMLPLLPFVERRLIARSLWAIITIAFSRGGSLWKLLKFFWLSSEMRVAFGDCTFDTETRELFRGDAPVHLSPKAFRLLELLLESRPRALSKEELQQELWPKTFVSEANLASLAAEARRAIGDRARGSKLLRTVYGFGYAFSGEAREERPAAGDARQSRFSLVRDEREVALPPGDTVLGRDRPAAGRIADGTVSRRHARITVAARDSTITDLGSKNGTFVNGKRVGEKSDRLSDGDRIQLGSVFLQFRAASADKSTETVRDPRRK